MTREEAKELLPIIQAYVEGKTIQFLNLDDIWEDKDTLLFLRKPYRYRIKPELKCTLPDSLSKRDVRHKFKQCPNSKEIIQKMYP